MFSKNSLNGEIGTNSLRFCLNCDCCKGIRIVCDGWWRPICKHWNSVKGTKENPYGPKTECKFFLEHSLLDNRRGFRLVSAECFIPLLEFMDKNAERCSAELYVNPIFDANGKRRETLFLKKESIESANKLTVAGVLNWCNDVLRNIGICRLSHRKKYERIIRREDKTWVSGQTEEI